MSTITIDEIDKDLRGYLHRVEKGETLIVLEKNRPVAEIKPIESPSGSLRPYGLCEGDFNTPSDFDEPLPDETLRLFEGR